MFLNKQWKTEEILLQRGSTMNKFKVKMFGVMPSSLKLSIKRVIIKSMF